MYTAYLNIKSNVNISVDYAKLDHVCLNLYF